MRMMKTQPQSLMSQKEKVIVRYIVERLSSLYRDGRGRAAYAGNMDQVMKDIFGTKRFCKTLEKGMYNETIMVSLMKSLGVETMWSITRSKEHFRMLSVLIAMDVECVRISKKMDKIVATEPAIRPSGKYKRLAKDLRHNEKRYKNCVKVFRSIFDIQDVGSTNQLVNFADDWCERYDSRYNGYVWDDMGASPFDSVESMDDYVSSLSRKGGKRGGSRMSNAGAFDIFNQPNGFDDYDDFDMGDDDADDYQFNGRSGDMANVSNSQIDRLISVVNQVIDARFGNQSQQAAPPPVRSSYHDMPQQSGGMSSEDYAELMYYRDRESRYRDNSYADSRPSPDIGGMTLDDLARDGNAVYGFDEIDDEPAPSSFTTIQAPPPDAPPPYVPQAAAPVASNVPFDEGNGETQGS